MRGSQGGLKLTCDGHSEANKFQDDDDRTQISVSWAGTQSVKGKEGKDKSRKAREDKTRKGSRKWKREKNIILADPRN